jgi:hypothetical protein
MSALSVVDASHQHLISASVVDAIIGGNDEDFIPPRPKSLTKHFIPNQQQQQMPLTGAGSGAGSGSGSGGGIHSDSAAAIGGGNTSNLVGPIVSYTQTAPSQLQHQSRRHQLPSPTPSLSPQQHTPQHVSIARVPTPTTPVTSTTVVTSPAGSNSSKLPAYVFGTSSVLCCKNLRDGKMI